MGQFLDTCHVLAVCSLVWHCLLSLGMLLVFAGADTACHWSASTPFLAPIHALLAALRQRTAAPSIGPGGSPMPAASFCAVYAAPSVLLVVASHGQNHFTGHVQFAADSRVGQPRAVSVHVFIFSLLYVMMGTSLCKFAGG